jgi:hypothetical protein
MPEKLHILLAKMAELENEINQTLRAQENEIRFHFRGKKVIFDRSIKEAHRKLKINFFRWLATRPQNLITGPIIYMMIFPILLIDIFVSFYQWTCFPVYGISKISRKSTEFEQAMEYNTDYSFSTQMVSERNTGVNFTNIF